ncbi:MAG TPA: hypothetical protein VEZ48_11750 [Sphingomonadaceae bacterium]|nr:hypothetical protein [Sphingomonadaceae bacterium]
MNDRSSDRAETAKRHDDSDIIDAAEDGALGTSAAGGNRQREVGSLDDMKRATDPDAAITGVQKSGRVQPPTATRSDFEGNN